MKAIILAAGKATRLLPLTKDIPQCLLKIGDKTIIELQIGVLNSAGIKDILVIVGYLANRVEKFCKENAISMLFNPFYDISGMALTIWIAKHEIKNGFIMLYSDILVDSKIISGLLKTKGDICLAVKQNGLREEAEKVIIEGDKIKNVTKDRVEGESGEFVGVAKFSSRGAEKLLEEIEDIAKNNLNASFIDVIDRLIQKGEKVTAYNINGTSFIDIDFPEDLKRAEFILKDR